MFERRIQHHIPAVLLLWRAATVTMHVSARRAGLPTDRRKARTFTSAVARHGAPQSSLREDPLSRPQPNGRLPLPSPGAAGAVRSPFSGHPAPQGPPGCPGAAARSLSYWAGLRSRLLPALRAAAAPVTAAACVAAAAGAHGHYSQQHRNAPSSLHGASHPPHQPPLPTHGSVEAGPAAPADMRTARQMLAARGFDHPGLQPGAAWGALPAGGGARGGEGEMHVMFEYLLLFPA